MRILLTTTVLLCIAPNYILSAQPQQSQASRPGTTRFYNERGQYSGAAQQKGQTTKFYDKNNKYSGKYQSGRFYDKSNRYSGSARPSK